MSCMCQACQRDGFQHRSSCAVHNGPALSVGLCDCRREFIDDHRILIATAAACWRKVEPSYSWHVLDWLCWKQRCKHPLTLHMFSGIITS